MHAYLIYRQASICDTANCENTEFDIFAKL